MSVQFLRPAGLCLLMLAIGAFSSTQAQAHGGLALAEDMCRLTIGPYNMHFTAISLTTPAIKNSARTFQRPAAQSWCSTTWMMPSAR